MSILIWKPFIKRGRLEGQIRSGENTIFWLQSTTDTQLKAYLAEGEVLTINPKSFESVGVFFAIKEIGRFYRHVLIEKSFPHHTVLAFKHSGKVLFEAVKMLEIDDISFILPKGLFYKTENPF